MDRGILNKSTAADFEPVSGFALTSICGMTHDGPSVCKQLEEYLLSKLSKEHAGVKLKVLRILRYAFENGCSIEFRRLIQRRSDVIRQCQSYRGTSDPLRGDAPNKDVRDEAQNVMKALFSSENNSGSSHPSSMAAPAIPQSRIQSVSSSDFGGYTATPNLCPPAQSFASQPQIGGRYMASVGNPNFDNYSSSSKSTPISLASIMTSENPGRDLISAVTSGVQSVAETLAKTAKPYIASKTDVGPSSHYSSNSSFSGSHPPSYNHANNFSASWVPPKIHDSTADDYQYSSSSDSSLQSARSLVNDLVSSNAARTTPTQQSLNMFVGKAEVMDGTSLGQVLASKLGDSTSPWVHKIKILCGIEAIHAANLDLVISSFLEHGGSSSLISLLSSPQVGTKARQVGSVLGLFRGQRATVAPDVKDQLIDFDTDCQEPQKNSEQISSNDLIVFGNDNYDDDVSANSQQVVSVTTPPSTSLI